MESEEPRPRSSRSPPPRLECDAGRGDRKQRAINGCVPLSHQVAGHMYGKDRVGILQHPDGTVLKQLQPPPRGPRELDFYKKVFADDPGNRNLLELQKYLPKYYGIWSPSTAPNDLYLKLEDVTRKFKKPCIMDVKIGRKSYDPYASNEKIQQQVSKYPLMEEIGFLVLGMRVYHANSDSYETHNQHYGRSLTKETVKDGVSRFFRNGGTLRKVEIAASIEKMQQILQWFESQDRLHFYASSLLFVYEGSSQQMTTPLGAETFVEKRGMLNGPLPEKTLEHNNNIQLVGSSENGTIESSVGRSLSEVYARHKKVCCKKVCCKRLHSQVSPKVEPMDPGNSGESNMSVSEEHINGNVAPQLESIFCHIPTIFQNSEDVEVRMIDFAHVFPSNARDEGYIYGLKHLIAVLQNILAH